MSMLGREEIEELIKSHELVKNYKSIDGQITANGFDIRVCAFIEVEKAGEISINKKDNIPPVLGKAHIMKGYEDITKNIKVKDVEILPEGEKVKLNSLKPYLVVSCEEVCLPNNMALKIEIRSSIFRYAQAILETAFGEAGYKGRLTFLMLPTLDTRIEIGSRIAQLGFYKLSSSSSYEHQKEFSYQGGKIL